MRRSRSLWAKLLLLFAAPLLLAASDEPENSDPNAEWAEMEQTIATLPDQDKLEYAKGILDFVAANWRQIDSATDGGINDGTDIYVRLGYFIFEPEFADETSELGAHASKIADQLAATGDIRAELTFLHLARYLQHEDQTVTLFLLRDIHRRAAAADAVDLPIVRVVRADIGEQMEQLGEEGRIAEAERLGDDTYAELAAAVSGESLGKDESKFLRYFAQTLALAGRLEESDGFFRMAFQQAQRAELPPEGAPLRGIRESQKLREIQRTANQWAFFLNAGGGFALAEEPGRFAAEEAVRLGERSEIWVQKARYNYAVSLLGQGKAAEALPFFEEALPLQLENEESGTSGSLSGDANRDTILLLTTLARARVQVSGREEASFEAALEAASRVRALRDERLRGGSGAGKADPATLALARAVARSAEGGDRRDPLSPAYDMVLAAGWAVRDNNTEATGAAFQTAQDLMLGEAGDAITQAAARSLAGDGPLGALVRERQDLAQALVSGDEAYREAASGTERERLAELRAELDRLSARLALVDARIDAEFPDYRALVAPTAIGLDTARAALGEGQALLVMLPSEGSQHVFAVTCDAVSWHRVEGGAEEVARLVGRLRCRLDEVTCGNEDIGAMLDAEETSARTEVDEYYPRFDRAAAYELYDQVIAPVAVTLESSDTVFVVAQGALASLPLPVLVTRAPTGNPESGDSEVLQQTPWLGDQHAFVTLPSVSALTLTRASTASASGGLVGYGAPLLEGGNESGSRSASTRRRLALRASPANAGAMFARDSGGGTMRVDPEKLRALDPLPGTERELNALAVAMRQTGMGLRLGANATEGAVKSDRELESAAIVVFATHGLLPGEMGQAAEPGLVFTPPVQIMPDDDGLLTASEAAELSLAARWVILSACNTATADGAGSSDALSSLARSFLYAGAQSLLVTHWRVADDASATLTVQTILAERDGASQAQALRIAQQRVRSGEDNSGEALPDWKPHWAHPSAWAPFVLISNRDG